MAPTRGHIRACLLDLGIGGLCKGDPEDGALDLQAGAVTQQEVNPMPAQLWDTAAAEQNTLRLRSARLDSAGLSLKAAYGVQCAVSRHALSFIVPLNLVLTLTGSCVCSCAACCMSVTTVMSWRQ